MSMEMAGIIGLSNFLKFLDTLIHEIEELISLISSSTSLINIFTYTLSYKFTKVFELNKDFPKYIDESIILTLTDTFNILQGNIVSNDDILKYSTSLYNILSEIKKNKKEEYNKMCANY